MDVSTTRTKKYYENLLKKEGKENKQYTIEGMAHRLRISRAKVYSLIKLGHLPAVKNGRFWVITEADFLYYINEVKMGKLNRTLRAVFGDSIFWDI